ncbi:hypothetical protein [Deinococcus cellulosilyticus]|uniref:Uncharacterized protein n=1 Tax=Deinococcus cellulosilyticus (strain DSM 18568 / NBRC 106333 / KACC 11606 / 5516J-15) TaxID=1223518 RepID=A0A511N493_DEIC1|nr:hypothetical protein [Deinococcus cellulosilyticus]GEM47287.1 hypothetical protein DC3_29220 [Deinococcus cellulosilyticus NBRC 106333 = KACC 11606]
MTLLERSQSLHAPTGTRTRYLLDCTTLDSTFTTLSSGLQVPEAILQDLLLSLPPRKLHSRKNMQLGPADDVLWREMKRLYPLRPEGVGTCWFHLTRVRDPRVFRLGLLNFQKALPGMWDTLWECARPYISLQDWVRFRENLGNHRLRWLYDSKLADPTQWGPHGMLIQEAAFQAHLLGNQDYLDAPETVLDICRCFHGTFGMDLLTLYRQNTHPCIVKFRTRGTPQAAWNRALYYCYRHLHQLETPAQSNLCFDGQGTGIAARDIVHVEVLPLHF